MPGILAVFTGSNTLSLERPYVSLRTQGSSTTTDTLSSLPTALEPCPPQLVRVVCALPQRGLLPPSSLSLLAMLAAHSSCFGLCPSTSWAGSKGVFFTGPICAYGHATDNTWHLPTATSRSCVPSPLQALLVYEVPLAHVAVCVFSNNSVRPRTKFLQIVLKTNKGRDKPSSNGSLLIMFTHLEEGLLLGLSSGSSARKVFSSHGLAYEQQWTENNTGTLWVKLETSFRLLSRFIIASRYDSVCSRQLSVYFRRSDPVPVILVPFPCFGSFILFW
jgi:hypothetical protein